MEVSVARQHAPVVDRGPAGEIGQPAPSFLDENLDGSDVPGLEVDLHVDLRLALRDQAVAIVVSESSRAARRVHEPHEPVPGALLSQDSESRMQHGGGFYVAAIGHMDRLAVPKRSL